MVTDRQAERNRVDFTERWKQVWGPLCQLTGLALIIRESLLHGTERPSLYVLWAGMIGFPIVWQRDSKRNGSGGSENGS